MTVISVLYQNQAGKFPQVQHDYTTVKKNTRNNFSFLSGKLNGLAKLQRDCVNLERKLENHKQARSLMDVIPLFRRTERVPEKLEKSEYIPAIGLVSLAILNGPEDMRDVMSGAKQVKAKVEKTPFLYSYDYKKMQHPFSFFKGTLLHNFVNPDKAPFPKLADWLVDKDITLFDTRLGEMVKDIFDLKAEKVETSIKHVLYTNKKPKFVFAQKFHTNSVLGDLTARALTRTTTLGALSLGAIEGAHFLIETQRGKDTLTAAMQSVVTYFSSMAGIAYGGAIGAKHAGPAGSLIGMAVGAIVGNKIPKYLNKD